MNVVKNITSDTIYEELATLIKRKKVVFFVGAGISYDAPSNLPVANVLLEHFASLLFPNRAVKNKEKIINTLKSKIRFEVFFQAFVDFFGIEAIELLKVIDLGEPNSNHNFLSKLSKQGYSNFICTTNFDGLLEKALTKINARFELIYKDKDFAHRINPRNIQILKFHGSLRDENNNSDLDSIRISVNQVGREINNHKIFTLKSLLKNYHIVFMGYSGMDDFDLLPIILTTKSPHSVYWINHMSVKSESIENKAQILVRTKNNPLKPSEKIVLSREKGFMINTETRNFVNQLHKLIWKTDLPYKHSKHKEQDFSYLEKWKKSIEFSNNKMHLSGQILALIGNYKEAVKCFQLVPQSSQEKILSIVNKAASLKHLGNYQDARSELLKLLNNKTISDPQKALILLELGLLEVENNKISEGRKYMFQAKKLKRLDTHNTATLYNNIGISYLFEADFSSKRGEQQHIITGYIQKALPYFLDSLKIERKNGSPYNIANVEDNLGLAYTFLGDYKRARTKHFKALGLYESLYQFREQAACLDNIGFFYQRQKNIGSH